MHLVVNEIYAIFPKFRTLEQKSSMCGTFIYSDTMSHPECETLTKHFCLVIKTHFCHNSNVLCTLSGCIQTMVSIHCVFLMLVNICDSRIIYVTY